MNFHREVGVELGSPPSAQAVLTVLRWPYTVSHRAVESLSRFDQAVYGYGVVGAVLIRNGPMLPDFKSSQLTLNARKYFGRPSRRIAFWANVP